MPSQRTRRRASRALQEAGIEFIHDGVRRVRKEADRDLVADLMKIAEESARLQEGGPKWTEEDLYDEDGLPK